MDAAGIVIGGRARRPPICTLTLLCILLYSLVSGVALFAQQVGFRSYTHADGLMNLSVPCLLQTRSGVLWLCTENGVERFDGTHFTRIGDTNGLDQSQFYALVEDAAGTIWLGTPTELFAGSAQHFAPVRYRGRALGIGIGAQLAPLPDGSVLILSGGLLYRSEQVKTRQRRDVQLYFNAAAVAAQPALAKLTALYTEPGGAVWLGCGTAICRLALGQVQQFAIAEGVPASNWRAFLLDRAGRLWARSFEHFVVLQPGKANFDPVDAPHARLTTATPFVSIVEDGSGRIVTRADDGLLRWTPGRVPGTSWEHFGPANGLPSAYVLSLLVDRTGALWIGTGGGGLLRWRGYDNWRGFTISQGLSSDVVWSVARDSHGHLIAGTSNGCSMFDEARRRFDPCHFAGVPITGEINAIVPARDGSLWLSSMAGKITRIDPRGVARQVAQLPYVRTVWRDAAGAIWFMTYRGVFRVEPDASDYRPKPVRIPGAEEADVSDVAEDSAGVYWFASVKGLFQFQDGRWRKGWLPPTSPSRFRSVAIGPSGELWAAGTERGLLRIRYDLSGIRHAQWVSEPIVAEASISTVRSDRRGWIWLTTDQGLILFDRRQWRRFAEADGLIWNDLNQSAAFFDTDGSVWLGTSKGLAQVLDPTRLVKRGALEVRLDHVSLGGQAFGPDGNFAMPWRDERTFNARFALADFDEMDGARFMYRMRGLETEWTTTGVPEARYSSLAPGHYRFEMRAFQPDHQRASQTVSASFAILPPWWQTIWFRTVIILALLIALVLLIQFSERRLRWQRRKLQNDLAEREALLQRATRDDLTGLSNRPAILNRLETELSGVSKAGQDLAIAMIDIDYFKAVNDTYGHAAGDVVLRRVSQELVRQVRLTDHVGRYGGEELLVIFPGLSEKCPSEAIEKLCEAIRAIDFGDIAEQLHITASFGVAWLRTGDSLKQLIARADAALYSAKERGRDKVIYAPQSAD